MSANVIIYFTPRDSTGVVLATYSTMRVIGGAIGPVIAGVFLSLFIVEVEDHINAGEIIAIPDATAFNIILSRSLSLTCYDPDDDNHATTSGYNGYATKQIISAT